RRWQLSEPNNQHMVRLEGELVKGVPTATEATQGLGLQKSMCSNDTFLEVISYALPPQKWRWALVDDRKSPLYVGL
ncbi:7943_t:CDS:2, partial [Paraglomus brasilianum]